MELGPGPASSEQGLIPRGMRVTVGVLEENNMVMETLRCGYSDLPVFN